MSHSSVRRRLRLILGLSLLLSVLPLGAQLTEAAPRKVTVDIRNSAGPVDRFFDLSVGSDYPGTLIRDDSQAQLKLAVDELSNHWGLAGMEERAKRCSGELTIESTPGTGTVVRFEAPLSMGT